MRTLRQKNVSGFTIIEVMIVLVIAAAILLVIFRAIPALQRNSRNTRRSSDAAKLAAAVNECLVNHNLEKTSCDSPSEIPLDPSTFSIYTGFHYGASGPNDSIQEIPTMDEPNWLFYIKCISNNTWQTQTDSLHTFAVGYFKEDANGGPIGRCMDG